MSETAPIYARFIRRGSDGKTVYGKIFEVRTERIDLTKGFITAAEDVARRHWPAERRRNRPTIGFELVQKNVGPTKNEFTRSCYFAASAHYVVSREQMERVSEFPPRHFMDDYRQKLGRSFLEMMDRSKTDHVVVIWPNGVDKDDPVFQAGFDCQAIALRTGDVALNPQNAEIYFPPHLARDSKKRRSRDPAHAGL